MKVERPYFMENPEWFYFDEKACEYKLTDKAPQDAIDSFNEYYELLETGTSDD